MKIRARQEYSELAEFHLTNHERLLEKYAGALMAESRQELDLNGGPMETEYRALVEARLEAFLATEKVDLSTFADRVPSSAGAASGRPA